MSLSMLTKPVEELEALAGLQCRQPRSKREWKLYHHLRYVVYVEECGLLPKADFSTETESDQYDDCGRSVAFLALRPIFGSNGKQTLEVLGCLRLILGRKVSVLPCEDHLEMNQKVDGRSTVEISRLIVAPAFRRHYSRDIIRWLTWQVRQYNLEHGIQYCYAAIEVSTFRLLTAMGFPLRQVGPVGDYMGEVMPTLLSMEDVLAPDIVRKIWRDIPEKAS